MLSWLLFCLSFRHLVLFNRLYNFWLNTAFVFFSLSNSSTDQKYYVGGLLLRHICQLVCNAHAITGLRVAVDEGSSPVHSQSQERIASAIYPTASLMNHACDPTVIARFVHGGAYTHTHKLTYTHTERERER